MTDQMIDVVAIISPKEGKVDYVGLTSLRRVYLTPH